MNSHRRLAALLLTIAMLATVGGIYAVVVAAFSPGDTPRFGSREASLAGAHLSPADHITRVPAGLRMTNPRQGIVAVFDRRGARIESGGRSTHLRLVALGHDARMTPIDQVEPEQDADGVSYHHGVVNEWFIDGPSGFEGGLTMARPPAEGPGPLVLSYAVRGDVTLGHRRLRTRDSIGRPVRSWFTARDGHLQLHIEDHGHTYPLKVEAAVTGGAP